MNNLARALGLLTLTVLPLSATAGGYGGAVSCADLLASGSVVPGATCSRADGTFVVGTARPDATGGVLVQREGVIYRLFRHVPASEVVRGRRCPYPHRPSDSVFANGAGYIIKDTVRARIGCVY